MKAVILAAGLGTRLRPLTVDVPKHLLPIMGRPVICWIVDALTSLGIREVGIVVGYKSEMIVSALEGYASRCRITYLTQGEQLGTAHAVMTARDYVASEDKFLVIYGDVTAQCEVIGKLIDEVTDSGARGGMVAVEVRDASRYGVVIESNGYLKEIVEKPSVSQSSLVNAGIYLLPKEVVPLLEEVERSPRGEYELTDVLNLAVKRGIEIKVVKLKSDWWYDVGRPSDLLIANLNELKRSIDGGIALEEDVELGSGSLLECTYVGRGTVIGTGASLRESVVMDYCQIGERAEVEHCLVLSNSYIGDGAQLRFCIVRSGTVVKEGESISGTPEDPIVI